MKVDINQATLLKYIKCNFWIYWIPKLGQWWYKKYLNNLKYEFTDNFFIQEGGVFFYHK